MAARAAAKAPVRPLRVKVPAVPPLVGVDEAGRGPVFGPLVVAGVRLDDARLARKLRRLGVADSKTLTPEKRDALAPKIAAVARTAVRVLDIETLNRRMANETLNAIEMDAFAEILAELGPGTAYLDACDVNAARFGHEVASRTLARAPRLAKPGIFAPEPIFGMVSEHKADSRFPIVAAASIVAKVRRDAEIAKLASVHGAIGSGYSHDPITRAFLKQWNAERGGIPPFARKFWATSRAYERAFRPLTDFEKEVPE